MRILVLQLARFGDIYQTWPTLHALKAKHPGAELHLLVRERFVAATHGLHDVTVHAMPTGLILQPALEDGDELVALARLREFLAPLQNHKFTHIVNLTFSPASSYMVDCISAPDTEVRGYTRHADGFLSIPDDSSAYFYAQVGIERSNRYHLTDVFAAVADVDLADTDFCGASVVRPLVERSGRIVVQLGASQSEKVYPGELWAEALKELADTSTGEIVLVGSADERALAERVAANHPRIINRAGQTSMTELFDLIADARLVLGADSAAAHVAALTQTPVLSLSSRTVNFWETGPRSEGSRVLFAPRLAQILPSRVAAEARALFAGQSAAGPCFERRGETFHPRQMEIDPNADFRWGLVQALYTGAEYPPATNSIDELAFQRLFELAELALMQLARWANPSTRGMAAEILAQVDLMLTEVERLNPNVAPLIQWFQTERLRLPPAAAEQTLESTRLRFNDLLMICSIYRTFGDVKTERAKAVALCETCVPRLREYEFASVQGEFQTLIATLHELARCESEVKWSSVLDGIDSALAARDYVDLADRLEYDLMPALI